MESTLKRELLTIKKDAIIITSNISISCAKKIKSAIKIQVIFKKKLELLKSQKISIDFFLSSENI